MRTWHVLKPNKRVAVPKYIIFYDTESNQQQRNKQILHSLRLGWCCYCEVKRKKRGIEHREEWFEFCDKNGFWKYVATKLKPKQKIYLVAHNQHFDFVLLDGFNYLRRMGFELTRWVIDANVFYMEWRKGEYKVCVLDSTNILKVSIKKLGEVLGLEKKEIDFSRCGEKELSDYCKRDVEILKEGFLNWIRFIVEHDLGNFKYTLAGQAFNAFKHRFMHHEIYIHDHPQATELEIESYRGGRCEAFYLGEIRNKIYYLDVNSLYPFVMKEFEYPTKLVKFGKHLTLDGLRRYLKRYCVIAKVLVTTDEPVFGLKNERLIFPVGTFQVALNTHELEYGLERNFIRGIYEYAVYERAPIFSDYVTYFNLLKEEYTRQGNRVMRWLTKLLLNSLYGKFGQRNERITFNTYDDFFDVFVSKYIDLVHNREGTLYCFAGKQYLKFRGEDPAFDSFIAIAAEVTANARMHLWNLMRRAGLENVYYVDTDSLFVNERGYKNLESEIDEVKLGKLKLEGVADRMIVRNVKDYVFENIEKIKGVKKGSRKISDNEFECLRFHKFRTLLRKGNLSQPVSEYFIKQLKREYKKGKVLDDGRVIPFVFPRERA